MRKKRSFKIVCLVLALAVLCSIAFTGCRRSDVLERKIYTENKNVDKSNQTKINNNDQKNQDQDQNITSKKETDDAQKERRQKDTKSVDGSGNNGSTSNKKYSASAPASGKAENAGNGTQKSNQTKGEGVTNTKGSDPGTEGKKQTVDPKGETITIPETSDKIAAVGGAAAIVEMLGGPGKLRASSQNFVNNSIAKNVFSSDMGNVKALWGGNGNSQISDAGLAELQTMLKGDSSGSGAVLYDSGTLTSAQVTSLNNAGIRTYPISLSTASPESYKEQVTAIGNVLGGDAVNKAKQYNDWFDDVINQAKSKASGEKKYTLFIQGWDSAGSWSVAGRSGQGLAIAPSKMNLGLFNSLIQTANIINASSTASGELGTGKNWYVNPLFGGGGGMLAVSLNGTLGDKLNESDMNKLTYVSADSANLGTSAYPGVTVGNRSIAQSLNADKNSGSGLWTPYPVVNSGSGSAPGFLYGSNIVRTTIQGDYSVNVLPSGVAGSWALGTPEGVLSAMWAANTFNKAGLDIKGELRKFYSTFCGKDLSDGDLTNILNGQ